MLRLDQATALESVDDTLYVGFNEDVELLSFPKLKTVGGALIIENNAMLKEVHLPALEHVEKYLHIHDNNSLTIVEMPRLKLVGGELSLATNPSLTGVAIGSAQAPTSTARVETRKNGAEQLAGLHAHARDSDSPQSK